MKPEISIVIPMYNVAQYIKECINSILNQTFPNFEIIIIDDGSTDDSYSIVETEFSYDKRIRLYHQENRGVSSARAFGVNVSIGNYIFFIDSDDTVENDVLVCLYNRIQDGYDVVQSESTFTGEVSGTDFVKLILEQKVQASICGKLIKKCFLTEKTMSIPREINVGEDLALNIKLGLLINKAYFISKKFYNYRFNPNSVISNRVRSLAYEIKFHKLITEILNERMDFYSNSYRLLQLSSLEGLILAKAKIDYNVFWIRDLMNNSDSLDLSLRHWIMLKIHNPFICRFILLVLRKINIS